MTSAAQLETTFAAAERAERQCRTGRRHVGRTRQLGLPAAPSEAGERGERGHQSTPELAPRAEQCSGEAAAVNAPVVPVASHAVAQDRGAGHAGALLPRPELNGNAALFPAPSCAPDPPLPPRRSDDGPAPQLLPPTDLPPSASCRCPCRSWLHRSRCVPLRSRRNRPGMIRLRSYRPARSVAPLLHPQRQRELIEQAAGMSTRQVAGLLAAAAPEVVPPRDTLRAVAPDRYTLKVHRPGVRTGTAPAEGSMSHLDPRMSWGDLVARMVRDAVARHDPRGGGNRHRRRRSAGSAGASPRRAPKTRRAAGAAAGPAQGVSESSRRAPNRTPAAAAPAAPARRGSGATPAPQGDTAAAERQNPIAMLANAAPPRQSAPAALSDQRRWRSGRTQPDGAHSAATPPASCTVGPGARAAVGGTPHSPRAGLAGRHCGAEAGTGVSPDGGPPGAAAGAAAHTTRDSVSPPRRHIPAAVRRHVWHRDGGRCCYRDPLSGRRCTSSHLLQIDHLLPVAQGGGPDPDNLKLACFAHHRMRHGHGHGPAPPPEPPL